jgi:hypothetical protein
MLRSSFSLLFSRGFLFKQHCHIFTLYIFHQPQVNQVIPAIIRGAPLKCGKPFPKLGKPFPEFGKPFPKFGKPFPEFGKPFPEFGKPFPEFGKPFLKL